MRLLRFLSCSAIVLVISVSAFAQQAPIRDPKAVAVLLKSLTAMGNTVPADSLATGTVKIVAGSKTDSGTIRILARGVEQSMEEVQTGDGTKREVFSKGESAQIEGSSIKEQSLEWAASGQLSVFPFHLVAAALAKPDFAAEYIGIEQENGATLHHLRIWNTYASRPKLRQLAEFSARDIWIDAATGLPRKVAYERRAGGGASDRIRMEVSYSDYRNVGGAFYPFRIEKALNGTAWTTIAIENVAFNTGLTDADFPVQKGAQ